MWMCVFICVSILRMTAATFMMVVPHISPPQLDFESDYYADHTLSQDTHTHTHNRVPHAYVFYTTMESDCKVAALAKCAHAGTHTFKAEKKNAYMQNNAAEQEHTHILDSD